MSGSAIENRKNDRKRRFNKKGLVEFLVGGGTQSTLKTDYESRQTVDYTIKKAVQKLRKTRNTQSTRRNW